MADTIQPAGLANLWRGSPPHVWGAGCLNARHRARACRICVGACPADAIRIPEDKADPGRPSPVVLNQDACVRCGICLSACPTGVFLEAESPESNLVQLVSSLPSQVIELACPRKDPPDMSRVPEASVVQTPRCLGAVSVPTLLQLTRTGKRLWLNDSICHNCPIGEAQLTIQRNITAANQWLQVMRHAPTVCSFLNGGNELPDEPVSRPVVSKDQNAMSRREFFRSWSRRMGQGTANLPAFNQGEPPGLSGAGLNRQPEDNQKGARRRLPHHIPAQRQQLAYALDQLSLDRPTPTPIPTAGLPIADIAVNEACTACGLCARFCPTEAISFVRDEEYYVLNFSAALCLGKDCSLCIIGCPSDALRFGGEVMADELLSTQPRPLKAGRLAACARCGALTNAPLENDESAEPPLCHVCKAHASRQGLASRLPRS